MEYWLIIFTIIFFVTTLISLQFGFRERARRKGRPNFDRSPIKLVPLSTVSSIFDVSELGYSLETEVYLIGDSGKSATTSEKEAWILCVLAKNSKNIFEFGTSSGRTTYLLAKNSPAHAKITTLTLHSEDTEDYIEDEADQKTKRWKEIAGRESKYKKFLYSGSSVERKIIQLFGDSKKFDTSAIRNQFDMIFIDGGHSYSYVKNDSEKAIEMCTKNGWIIWHDFSPSCEGVWKYLNEIARTRELKHIEGTRLVIMKNGFI